MQGLLFSGSKVLINFMSTAALGMPELKFPVHSHREGKLLRLQGSQWLIGFNGYPPEEGSDGVDH